MLTQVAIRLRSWRDQVEYCPRGPARVGHRFARQLDGSCMKLIVQPDSGIAPIISAIKQARKWMDILIFRLDRPEIARALAEAVARGVRVRALTAHQNRGGTKSLRKLEMQLLAAGVTVSRTATDLVRYHGKMAIVDNRILHVYGFNF